MGTFAALYFSFFAAHPDHCMRYESDAFGMHGEVCNRTATWAALGSGREFPCGDGVTVRNEDDSLLAVYQCRDGRTLVFTGSEAGNVILYDKRQNVIYKGKVVQMQGN